MDLRIVNKSDKEAEIFIDDIIGWDESSWMGIKKQLAAIADSKIQKLIVNINSPGGMVSDGLMIHDALKMSKAHIETRVFSMSASSATIIAQSGDTRKMSANALYLVHHASAMAWGNVNELKVAVDDLEKVDARLLDIYIKKGADPEKVKALMDENNGTGKWIDAEEALSVGLIDEIFEPSKAAALARPSVEFLNKYNLPQIPDKYMENVAEKVDEKTILNKIEDLFNRVFPKKEEKEPEKVEDIAPEVVIEDKVEIEDQSKEILAAKDTEIETLKKSLQEKETELSNVKSDLATALTQLGQLDASSTLVPGSEGKLSDEVTEDVPFANDIKVLNAKLNPPVKAKRDKNPEKE